MLLFHYCNTMLNDLILLEICSAFIDQNCARLIVESNAFSSQSGCHILISTFNKGNLDNSSHNCTNLII